MIMRLSIIIVNFNTKKYLKKSIDSIDIKKDWEIIVVDNASTDGSIEMLKKNFSFVKIIKNKKNLGFSKANNIGIKACKGEYVLLLNSDTCVEKGAIKFLLQTLQKDSSVGIASSQLKNKDGSIQPQGGFLPRLTNIAAWMLFLDDLPLFKSLFKPYQLNDKKAFNNFLDLGWVSGTAMLMKKDLIKRTGYLNEDLFMYGEDVEFCIRIKQSGYRIVINPQAKIVHFSHISSGGDPSSAILGEYRGLKYIFKHSKPKWEYPIVRLLLKLGAILRMFVFGILQGKRSTYDVYKKAFFLA